MRPERPSDPPLQSIQLSRGRASYTDEGEGPALVALHGLPGSVRDYRWLGASLPSNVRFLRLDMPGFGGTERSCEPKLTLAARASFVTEFLEAMNLDSCYIMGHSMGGPVALEVAVRNPSRVQGLVLLASVGLRPHRTLRRQPSPKIASYLFRIPGVSRLLRIPLRKGYQRMGFPSSLSDEEMVLSIHIIGAFDFKHMQENQRRLQTPTFLGWAEDDRLIETEIFEEHAAACPEGPRRNFPTGGHNIQKTQAVEIGEALTTWLHSKLP